MIAVSNVSGQNYVTTLAILWSNMDILQSSIILQYKIDIRTNHVKLLTFEKWKFHKSHELDKLILAERKEKEKNTGTSESGRQNGKKCKKKSILTNARLLT